jgi:ribosomal protein L11 methylase PrmA
MIVPVVAITDLFNHEVMTSFSAESSFGTGYHDQTSLPAKFLPPSKQQYHVKVLNLIRQNIGVAYYFILS